MSGGESAREAAEAFFRGWSNVGGPDIDKLEAAFEARDASLAAREAKLREALERIGLPDEDDCCPVCEEHEPSCSLDSMRFPEMACLGAIARRALAAPGTPGREGT